jgi:hypothetical protein
MSYPPPAEKPTRMRAVLPSKKLFGVAGAGVKSVTRRANPITLTKNLNVLSIISSFPGRSAFQRIEERLSFKDHSLSNCHGGSPENCRPVRVFTNNSDGAKLMPVN